MRSPDHGRSGFARVSFVLAFIVPLLVQAQSQISLGRTRAVAGETQSIRWESEREPFSSISSVTTEPALKFPVRAVVTSANGISRVELTAPPSTPAGEYGVQITGRDGDGRTITATVDFKVDSVTVAKAVSGRVPVILLNGWQFVCSDVASTLTASQDTFGSLWMQLQNQGVPVAYFNNCAYGDVPIESLGAELGAYISTLTYTDGTPVTQVDLVAHSMGGLIARAYLAGLQTNGTFSPPPNPQVRKLIEIATPNFGSFWATKVGTQVSEMYPGSSFLWNLARWNQNGDDLRGVDALAIIGNAGSCCTWPFPAWSNASDGIVSITSASLGFASQGNARNPLRTRVVPYCHTDVISPLPNCAGPPIAKVDQAPETGIIVLSFLANTSDWESTGTSNQTEYGGVYFALANAAGTQYTGLDSVSFGAEPALQAGFSDALYYSEFLSGTGTFEANQTTSCGPFSVPGGYYTAFRCKYNPVISLIGPVLSGAAGLVVQSGGYITINGVGFGQSQCSGCRVLAYPGGVALAVSPSSWSDQAITVFLPSTFNGFSEIVVQAASGSDSITFMAAPAVPAVVPPTISLSSLQTQFAYTMGGAIPPAQTITVSNSGGGTFTWSASASASWIIVSSASGVLTVSVNPANLSAGPYSGTITITAPGASNNPQTISVKLTVTAPAPTSSVTVTSVSNAASGASGAIAPGEMVAIKGSGLGPATGVSFSVDPNTGKVDTTLAGTQVFFGSYAAPITYTSAGQINAIVPYEVAGQSITMQVQYHGAASAGTVLQMATAAPGAFTFNGTGTGQAIAANQDGSFNGASNPAAPGSYVTIYFTGGGETNPPGADGSVTGSVLKWLTQPVSVTVGGVAAAVAFDGAAPTFVDGVGQLNIQLANNTPSGTQPVFITVGGIPSPATASLSVQ